MGSKTSKEIDSGQPVTKDVSPVKRGRRRKSQRYHSNKINLRSLGGLESGQNIDKVLSDMGVQNVATVDTDSGRVCSAVVIKISRTLKK